MVSTKNIIPIFLLASSACSIIVSYCALTEASQTYLGYENPYTYAPMRPHIGIDSKYERAQLVKYTLIFVIDGLRYDVLHQVNPETISRLIEEGTEYTNAQCFTLSSSSVPSACAIGSGASPWISEVIGNEYRGNITIDSIFWVAKRNNSTTASVGSGSVLQLFREHVEYKLGDPSAKSGEWQSGDSVIGDWAVEVAYKYQPKVMWVHLGDTDHMGHGYGALSPNYANAVVAADAQIGKVLKAYEALGILDSTLIIVTADHGHVDTGGHGGWEPEVLHVPLILWSPRVVKAGVKNNDTAHLDTIAPTVSMLMGWEVPSDSSGRVLFEALALSNNKYIASYKIHLAEIRLAQANITLQKTSMKGKYEHFLADALSQLEIAERNYGMEPAEAIGNAEQSEALSMNISSFVQFGAALLDKSNSEIAVRSMGGTLAIIVVAVAALPFLTRVRRRIWTRLITEKEYFMATLAALLLYYAVLVFLLHQAFQPALSIQGTTWKISPSYLKSYEAFYLTTFAVTGFSLIASGSFLFSFMLNKAQSENPVWTVAFLTSIMILNMSLILGLSVKGSCGLFWFTTDLGEVLMCGFLIVSNLLFALLSILFYAAKLGFDILLRKGRNIGI